MVAELVSQLKLLVEYAVVDEWSLSAIVHLIFDRFDVAYNPLVEGYNE